ncbi:hypothetical protein [Allorhizocola rhizosphaerae]|nr:hypothetical protein [Allorhizocola rhizosphaerae]
MIADLTRRALAESDLVTIPVAFAEPGWPGENVLNASIDGK